MTDSVLTLHPEGKEGVNIERTKYDVIRTAIVDALAQAGTLTFAQLTEQVRDNLGDSFDGSINWYVTSVKLDLEARGVVERLPKTRPQQLRLTTNDANINR